MNFGDLTGRRIVVTGASSGIGRAIALECARAGADLVITYCRSASAAQAVAAEIAATERQVHVHRVDISDAAARQRFVAECFDLGAVDGVVNNAGADLLTSELRQADYSERLRTLLDVDVIGTVELSRAFGHRMKIRGHGAILTIGWDQADRGMEGESGELFATAKNAIMGLTRSLAVSLAPDVRVNCLAPGWIRTAWGETASEYWQERVISETPLRRWGTPEDIAAAARFLLSDSAGFITGQVINVNGGAVR